MAVTAVARVRAMAWIEAKRLARGWRWRSLFLIAIAGAYWFSRMSFAEAAGATAWFPAGEWGVAGFAIFFAAAAVVLGVDSLAVWTRGRARTLLDSRLIDTGPAFAARVIAISALMMAPAITVCFWPTIGAWRGGLHVLWTPPFLFLIAAAAPLIVCGAAAGLCLRSAVQSDAAAFVLAVIALAPVAAYRILSAPSWEFFQLASDSLGILVPARAILWEAFVCYLYALTFIGAASLLLPRPRPGRNIPNHFRRVPILAKPYILLERLSRQWPRERIFAAGVLIAIGACSFAWMIANRPLTTTDVAWSSARQPEALKAPRIARVAVLRRVIVLPDKPGDSMRVTLRIASAAPDQSLAAFTFGPTLAPISASSSNGPVIIDRAAVGRNATAVVLQFAQPIPATGVDVELVLAPPRRAERLWQRAYHPRFHRFSFLGPWYGEPAELDYGAQSFSPYPSSSPFTIDAPAATGLTWLAGAAQVLPGAPGRVLIEQPNSDVPSNLLAAELVKTPPAAGADIFMLTLPNHAETARQLQIIFAEEFIRIHRTLGAPPEPIYLYEVPEQDTHDPLALPSGMLDLMQKDLPFYNDQYQPTRSFYFESIGPIHRGAVREIVTKSISVDSDAMVRDTLIDYLSRIALGAGKSTASGQRNRRDNVFVPWPDARGDQYPFDVSDADRPQWTRPFFDVAADHSRVRLAHERLLALHHMIRNVLGEDAYEKAIHDLFGKHRGEPLTLASYRAAMEEASGKDLEWLFDEWIIRGVLPAYRIKEGQAVLAQNPATRAIQYSSRVTVANVGTGRMPVPVILVTEGEAIRETVWLDSGEQKELTITTLDRPVAFEIDPDGWIAQEKPSRGALESSHTRILFKAITEL
ncbi:hypothetical protein BH09SUM1_BH09SUM1_05620 [soil metagenome]